MARRSRRKARDADTPDPRLLIDWVISEWDSASQTTIAHRKTDDVRLTHGLVGHVVNSARAALVLIDAGMVYEALPQIRNALESAVAAQWVLINDDGVEKFIAHATYKSKQFKNHAVAAGVTLPPEVADYYAEIEALRASKLLGQIKTMFDSLDPSGWLYLVYSNLSAFNHPSSTLIAAYLDTSREPNGLLQRVRVDPQPHLTILALAVLLAFAAFSHLERAKPRKSELQDWSAKAGMPLWLTKDGKAPSEGKRYDRKRSKANP